MTELSSGLIVKVFLGVKGMAHLRRFRFGNASFPFT
jgi:hypothetical protein